MTRWLGVAAFILGGLAVGAVIGLAIEVAIAAGKAVIRWLAR